MESNQIDTENDAQPEPPRGKNSTASAEKDASEMDIDPENEVKGIKLLMIHIGICLCTFLIGLVSYSFNVVSLVGQTAD